MTKRKVVQPGLIDLLLADYQKPEDLLSENGILKQLAKALEEVATTRNMSVNMRLRKVTKSRSSFPNDDALIY